MRWILSLGMLAAVCAWAGSAAAYQPAPPQIVYYDYQVIPAYRGQACTMPPSFTPGPICCESACCCCLHVWDDYCQPKPVLPPAALGAPGVGLRRRPAGPVPPAVGNSPRARKQNRLQAENRCGRYN